MIFTGMVPLLLQRLSNLQTSLVADAVVQFMVGQQHTDREVAGDVVPQCKPTFGLLCPC